MDDDERLRSRNFDLLHHQEYLQTHHSALAAAYDRTDPTTQQTAVGKDHEAWQTLLRAGDLTDAIAGWALDHVYGLSLAGIKMLPLQPALSKSHPEYVEYRRSVDVHDHEIVGGRSYDTEPTSPEIKRLILRNLVFAGGCALPRWLRDELIEALDALDAGTCTPLFEPTKRVGTEYFKARARLRLVSFVKFRSRAYATSEEKVRELIGSRIGRSAEAIKDWEQRLRESCLGSLEVHRQIEFALNAASYVRHAATHGHTGAASERDLSLARHHEQRWNSKALDQAIAEWKEAEGIRTRA